MAGRHWVTSVEPRLGLLRAVLQEESSGIAHETAWKGMRLQVGDPENNYSCLNGRWRMLEQRNETENRDTDIGNEETKNT